MHGNDYICPKGNAGTTGHTQLTHSHEQEKGRGEDDYFSPRETPGNHGTRHQPTS